MTPMSVKTVLKWNSLKDERELCPLRVQFSFVDAASLLPLTL